MIDKIKAEISKINDGCGKELGEDFQELSCGEDFDNEKSPSGGSFILCQECREKLFKEEGRLEGYKKAQKIQDEKVKKLKEYLKTMRESEAVRSRFDTRTLINMTAAFEDEIEKIFAKQDNGENNG